MNYWKHSLLSKKKFGGAAEDYLLVHKFMDSSKLFHFNYKHRILLHHTYGIHICIRKFGETLLNSDGRTILIRDIAAEHCKEDLCGIVPTLNQWFTYTDEQIFNTIKPVTGKTPALQEFLWGPYLMSGLQHSLIITHSNFGVYLAKELLGLEAALELAAHVEGAAVSSMLSHVKCTERWQYVSDIKQLKTIEDELA